MKIEVKDSMGEVHVHAETGAHYILKGLYAGVVVDIKLQDSAASRLIASYINPVYVREVE